MRADGAPCCQRAAPRQSLMKTHAAATRAAGTTAARRLAGASRRARAMRLDAQRRDGETASGTSATRASRPPRGERKVSEASTSVPPPRRPEPAPRCPRPSARSRCPAPCRVAVARVRASSSSEVVLGCSIGGIALDRRLERRRARSSAATPPVTRPPATTRTPSRFPACDAARLIRVLRGRPVAPRRSSVASSG